LSSQAHYDVFLSHNSADKAAVELIAHRLQGEASLNPFLDKWHLIPGEAWQEALAEALAQSATVAVFVGPSGVSPWHNEEMRVALDKAVRTRDEYRVIPVLLPGAEPESLDKFLAQRTWVDFRAGLDDAQAFERLVAGIKGEAVVGGAYTLPDEPAPYRGLLYFREEDARFFFGRGDDCRRLVEKLGQSPFVALIGASGSGKSSLIRAGLLPALAEDALPGSGEWHTLVFTPGSQPLRALADQLATLVPVSERLSLADDLADRLAQRPDGLRTAITTLLAERPRPVLLVIDQFEELFTLCQDGLERCRAQAKRFIANLVDTAQQGDGRIRVLITLRADFLDRCLVFPELGEWLEDRQVLLGALSEAALREAVVGPAREVGAFFEKGLVGVILRDVKTQPSVILRDVETQPGAILRDVETQPGVLPLLQHALYELWRARRGPWLTLEAYEDKGGVRGALQRRAQATYEALTPEQQQIARTILVRLTTLGEGVSDTRRRASRSELYPAGVDPAQVDQVLQALSGPEARLIIVEEQSVEIAHETLIQQWDTLRQCLEKDREAVRVHRRLTEAAQEWIALKRDPGALYRGMRLDQAGDWDKAHAGDFELNAQEYEFLRASQELARREAAEREAQQQREVEAAQKLAEAERQRAEEQARSAARLRRRAYFLTGALAIAAMLAVVALVFGQQADQNARRAEAQQATAEAERNRAEQQAHIARSGELAALALSRLGDRLDLSFLLSAEAFRGLDTYQTRGSLLETVQASPYLDRFLRGHSGVVNSVAFSPDGKTLASGALDGTIILWDVANRQPIGQPLTGHPLSVSNIAFSPDGKTLASGSWDGTVTLWDVASRQPIGQPLTGHSQGVTSVAFSPDGRTLASGALDGTIILWDVSTALKPGLGEGEGTGVASRQLIDQPLTGHSFGVSSVAFSPDGKTLASSARDGAIILWDAASRQPIGQPLSGHSGVANSVAFSPDGKTLASGNTDGAIILWDVASRQPIGQPLTGHSGVVHSVAFSPDGKTLASGSHDRTIILWDVSTALKPGLPAPAAQAQVSEGEGTGVASRQPIGQPLTGHSGVVYSVAFSPDGKRLASGSDDQTVILWDVTNRPPIGQPLTGHSGMVNSVAFSPDGQMLASGGCGKGNNLSCVQGEIILWDVASRLPIGRPLRGHSGVVNSVAFSPDGKTLASGSADGTVILWNVSTELNTGVASRQPIGQPLSGRSGSVQSVAFSPDGKTLASGNTDGTLILWDADPQSWLARACRIVGRNFTRQEWGTYFPGEPYRKTCEQWPEGE
jgi:WD40 repeat protein